MFKMIFKICFYLPLAIFGAFMTWCILGFVAAGIIVGMMTPTHHVASVVKTSATLPAKIARR